MLSYDFYNLLRAAIRVKYNDNDLGSLYALYSVIQTLAECNILTDVDRLQLHKLMSELIFEQIEE